MTFKIRYEIEDGFRAAMVEAYRPIAIAAKMAMLETAETVKLQARADIAAAGFGKRWQNALRVDVYPSGKLRYSVNAAALIYHKIPYADVFETGATIRAKKNKLWLPLKHTPKKASSRRMTPKVFQEEIGSLFTMKIGGKPYLAAKMSVTKAQIKSGNYGKVTTTRLRKGAAGAELTRAVPLYHGVDSVKIRDRFSIREITDRAADNLAALYAKHLIAD